MQYQRGLGGKTKGQHIRVQIYHFLRYKIYRFLTYALFYSISKQILAAAMQKKLKIPKKSKCEVLVGKDSA